MNVSHQRPCARLESRNRELQIIHIRLSGGCRISDCAADAVRSYLRTRSRLNSAVDEFVEAFNSDKQVEAG